MKHPFFRKKDNTLSANYGPLFVTEKDKLPRWDLSTLYSGTDARDLQADMDAVDAAAKAFAEDYEERVATLSGDDLGDAIARYEKIEAMRHKIYCFVYLREQADSAEIPRNENIRKWLTESGDRVSFFEGEINDMKDRDLITKLRAPELAKYAPWIASVRADRGYLLDNGIETMSRDLDEANGAAWRRLYDQTMAGIHVMHQGKKITFDAANNMAGSPDLSQADRAEIRARTADALEKESARVALIYNVMMKDRLIDSDLRKYTRADQELNAANGIDDHVIDTMRDTIKASYTHLSHRYYRWKAEQHHVDIISRSLLSSPLPETQGTAERKFSWNEARKTVLKAFRRFSPKFARIAQKILDDGHVDAEPRPGKETGGFAMPVGDGHYPYILINFTGKTEDVVSALGHELGHGVHQVLSDKAQKYFLSDMPTTIAETASIFAEMLVFDDLLKSEKDPAARKKLLMEKVESMLDNGLRQLAYYEFEMKAHHERKSGELSVERLSDLWIEAQEAYFGPSVELDKLDRYRWMTIPHFYDTPFYVYSYAFAQVMVGGLYNLYKQAEKEGPAEKEAFVQNYITLLETGITKNLREMFEPFGLDPDTPQFWQSGLSLMESYLDELSGTPKNGLKNEFEGAALPKTGRPLSKNRPPRRPAP